MTKTYEHRLERDPVGGGAPRVDLKSARLLRMPFIAVKTSKETKGWKS
jgi:hypothetical protein